jgi:glutamate/tyrosine decarboxylase-like PLP-dependent enzyme
MSERPADPLGLPPEDMRRLGYWVVDTILEHFTEGPDGPAIRAGSPQELAAALGGPPPQEPGDALEAMQTLVEVALGHMQHGDHPRFFARVPSPSSFAGVLGEWLGTGFNAIASSWAGGSGPSAVELVVIEWLRQLMGLPAGTEGVLVSGGSLASLTGLASARRERGAGVAYLSDQTHASILRDLRVLGYGPEDVRVLPSDHEFRLAAETVAGAVAEDRGAGRHPTIVVATAGTTNTGAVDPLDALADLCDAEELWLHVDGAYGAPAALCERGRQVLAGLERSDSLVLDPHKWLFQPLDLGCLLVRHPGALAGTFAMTPEYLADVTGQDAEVDLRDRSLELSRRARALKLWLAFRTYGVRRIGEAIARGIELAEHAQDVLEQDTRWELVTPAQLGIVTFTLRDGGEDRHALRTRRLADDGFAAVSTTTLRGRTVLRLCTINPRTSAADIEATLERLAAPLHT